MGLGKYERKCKCGCGKVVNIKKENYYMIEHMQRNFYIIEMHYWRYVSNKLQMELNAEYKRKGKTPIQIDQAQVRDHMQWMLDEGHAKRMINNINESVEWRICPSKS